MLTAVLVLQAFILLLIIALSIVGWRKLIEDRHMLTTFISTSREDWQKLTGKLTKKRVSVSYEHVIHHEDGLFRNKVVASYRVQFLYDGLPIGEPTEKIVYYANKVDKEAVQEALTAALQTMQIAIEASGTSLTVLNKVGDVIRTLSK